jgi:hypothetical protein
MVITFFLPESKASAAEDQVGAPGADFLDSPSNVAQRLKRL